MRELHQELVRHLRRRVLCADPWREVMGWRPWHDSLAAKVGTLLFAMDGSLTVGHKFFEAIAPDHAPTVLKANRQDSGAQSAFHRYH